MQLKDQHKALNSFMNSSHKDVSCKAFRKTCKQKKSFSIQNLASAIITKRSPATKSVSSCEDHAKTKVRLLIYHKHQNKLNLQIHQTSFFFCGAVRARSSDGHQSICNDCPFPRMRKSETIPKVSLETKATRNKQKQHKTATNHKQQTNNPGHLAKKVKHNAFRSIPLSLSTAPRRNSNITHSHPTCSKVIITCDDDTSRIEPLLNVVVYATNCSHLDKTSYHRQHTE